MGCDPIQALAYFVLNKGPNGEPLCEERIVGKGDNEHVVIVTSYDPAIRVMAAKELAQYVAPKRKAVEHSHTQEEPFKLIIEAAAQAGQPLPLATIKAPRLTDGMILDAELIEDDDDDDDN